MKGFLAAALWLLPRVARRLHLPAAFSTMKSSLLGALRTH